MPRPDEYGTPPTSADTVVIPRVEPDTMLLSQVEGRHRANAPAGPTARPVGAELEIIPVSTESGPDPEADTDGQSVARNSGVMALGSIVSRLTGLIRTVAIAAAVGAKLVADDYTQANTLPNLVYELLLGGVLASVIVPVLVKAQKHDADGGEAYTQRLFTLATLFFGAATVIAVAAAAPLTAVLLNQDTAAADRHLTTVLAYMLLPEIFFYGMAAMFSALLNVRGHFAAPMWTPILNNIVVIVTAGLFALVQTGAPEAATMSALEIAILGIGTSLGIVVQTAGLLPAMRKVGFRWRWRWDFHALDLRELAKLGSWMLLYVAATQIGVFAVIKIARLAGDQGAPGPAIYNNAFLIFMMAHGIVGVSIGTALMPRMSAAAAEGRMSDLSEQFSLGTRLTSVVLIPASAAYLVLGRPLAVALFEGGAYTHASALDTAPVIAAAGLTLLPYAVSQLQIFVFYALSDTRLPALINIPVIASRLVMAYLFWLLLPAGWVVTALMGGSAISFIGVAVSYWFLRREMGQLDLARISITMIKLTIAAAAGGAAAWLAVHMLTNMTGDGKAASVLQLIVGGLVLVVGYGAAAMLLRVREIQEVGRMLGGRLRRS